MLVIKAARKLEFLATIANSVDLVPAPPIANSVFSDGLDCFKAAKSW